MPKSNKRPSSKLHCQHCGKPRLMFRFFAINTEQKDKESNVYPFDVRKFLEIMKGKSFVRLPRFYAGTCSTCYENTFYQGQNHGTSLVVIPT